MPKYKIVESVGTTRQDVHDYSDLEMHHPSKHGREPGRHYHLVDGRNEEILSRGGRTVESSERNLFVSKDFILLDADTGKQQDLHVPAPVAGYIKVIPDSGLVQIYDKLPGGEMMAQVRHMDLRGRGLKDGDYLQYGQAMGIQAGMGGGHVRKYPTHVHIDFNVAHLDKFDRYLRDIDTGAITTDHYPNHTQNANAPAANPAPTGHADQVLDTQRVQHLLNKLGYRDRQGHSLVIDGEVGMRTQDALSAFHHAHHLKPDGLSDMATLNALRRAEHAPSPVDPCHRDHALYRQTLNGVHILDKTLGRTPDAASQQMAASLTLLAKENGLKRVDHVVLNEGNAQVDKGENVFIVQGRIDDPAHLRAHTKTQLAAQTPVVDSFRKIEVFNLHESHEQGITNLQHGTQQVSVGQHASPSMVR